MIPTALLAIVVELNPLGQIPSASVAKLKTVLSLFLASIRFTPLAELFAPIGITAT